MRKLVLLLVFILLTTSCSPFFTGSEATETSRAVNTPILQRSQEEPTVIITAPTPTESERGPTATAIAAELYDPALPDIIRFRTEQIYQSSLCPTVDFVPVQNLGIPPKLGLLLADGNVSDSEAEAPYPIFIYKPTTELPGNQLPMNVATRMHSVPIPSPDGRHFYYRQYDKGQPARTLVVQSIDGHKRKFVWERDYPFGYPSWIDDRHILWTDIPDPEIYWSFGGRPDYWEYVPTHLIDIQTLETEELPPLPFPTEDGGITTVNDFVHTATGNHVLLQHVNKGLFSYEIYSYTTQTSQPVYSWLPDKFLRDPWNTRDSITPNGKMYFIALDGNVFWIVSPVRVEQVLSGTDALADQVYEFTFPEESTPSFIPYYFETRNAFLYTHENILSEDILEAVPQNLYRLDIDSQTIYDYCFDIQKWRGSMSVSPDEEFVAITLHEDPRTNMGKKDTILINLTTGDRALLPNYQVFGWVSVNN